MKSILYYCGKMTSFSRLFYRTMGSHSCCNPLWRRAFSMINVTLLRWMQHSIDASFFTY